MLTACELSAYIITDVKSDLDMSIVDQLLLNLGEVIYMFWYIDFKTMVSNNLDSF